MADAEIQILISAQDKISGQLKSIEGKIQDFSSQNQKATEKMTAAWTKGTQSLIAIGNAAASVDAIFSAMTNLTLRLENAQLRLITSQESLTDAMEGSKRAGRDLERAQRELAAAEKNRFRDFDRYERALLNVESAQERVTDANKQEERAARSLQIAQNNLERANNAVLGTYINIGVQSLTLATSVFPMLVNSLRAVGVAASAANLGAIGLVFGGLTFLINKVKEAGSTELYQPFQNGMSGMIRIMNDVELKAQALQEKLANLFKQMAEFEKVQKKLGGSSGFISPGRFTQSSSGPSVPNLPSVRIGDGIIKPDGTVIQTDPRDTLVAMKDIDTSVRGMNRGGTVINIYGNDFIGTGREMASQMSRLLLRELSTKRTI